MHRPNVLIWTAELEKRRQVKFLIILLVSRTVSKANVNLATINLNSIADRLFSRVMVELDLNRFRLSSDIIEKYDEELHTELVQMFRTERRVLYHLMSKNHDIETFFASRIIRKLIQPERPTFTDSIKSSLKHWPCMLVTAGVISAALWAYYK